MSAARQTNQMRMQALLAMGALGKPKHGLVTSYDGSPGAYRVKVMLQPEGIETGWLPITTLMAGQGFGVYFGPSQGDQATVLFQEGDREVGFCIGFLPSDEDQPPAVASGEIHLICRGSDASIVMKPDGSIASVGTWTHTGAMHVTQDITCDTTVIATTDVIGGGKHLKTHTHSGVQTGGGNTGAPN